MKVAQFTKTGFTYYTVVFAYDPDLVELIKQTVPAYAREWKPSTKEWTVDDMHAHRLAAAMRSWGVTVLGIEEPPPQQPGQPQRRRDLGAGVVRQPRPRSCATGLPGTDQGAPPG